MSFCVSLIIKGTLLEGLLSGLVPLPHWMRGLNKSNYDIIGTSVNGDNIRNFSRIDKGIIVLGNESNL
mgnify:CR=1 FL=1